MRRVAPLVLLIALCAVTHADTRRVAVLVGNNAGHGENPPLRYAEADAGKLAQTLVELGNVDPADLYLLQGRSLAALRDALHLAKQKVAAMHRTADARVVLVFYYSGHSDGESLEIGRDRLGFAELKQWLSGTGAEVRVAIVDSCKSGALLAAKGGRPGPAFQIRLSDDLASSGEALLTSSAADELALESREIRGSFFTHHLVSGLRGAADSSGDGTVTLAEAYQYAFARTVSATAATLVGPQHPAYDYRLSGQGELVLSTLSRPSGALEVPRGFDRVLVIQLVRDQVLAEIPAGASVRVAVPPGPYAIRAWNKGRVYAGRVEVAAGDTRVVRAGELGMVAAPVAVAKGGEPEATVTVEQPTSRDRRPSLFVAPGVQRGVAATLGVLGSLRIGLRDSRPSGWSVALDLSTARGDAFWETTAIAFAGYRFGFERGRFRGYAGLEIGAGVIAQNTDAGGAGASATVLGAPGLGASVRLGSRYTLALEGHAPIGWMRRDGRDALAVLPAGWLGLLVQL